MDRVGGHGAMRSVFSRLLNHSSSMRLLVAGAGWSSLVRAQEQPGVGRRCCDRDLDGEGRSPAGGASDRFMDAYLPQDTSGSFVRPPIMSIDSGVSLRESRR